MPRFVLLYCCQVIVLIAAAFGLAWFLTSKDNPPKRFPVIPQDAPPAEICAIVEVARGIRLTLEDIHAWRTLVASGMTQQEAFHVVISYRSALGSRI